MSRQAGILSVALAAVLAGASCSGDGTAVVISNQPPDAAFSYSPATPSITEVITFDAGGSEDPDGEVVEYLWDFEGDGTAELSTADSLVTHSYATAGDHTVILHAVDDRGATDSIARIVTVINNRPPTPGFTFSPATPAINETVTFDASASSDGDGTVVEYRWDWEGDGTWDESRASPGTAHAFPAAGSYEVMLQVVDDDGAAAIGTRTVDVAGNQAPTAGFTFSPATPAVGQTVTFDASGSSDPDGTISEYRWDFDGDGTFDAVSATPSTTHAYGIAGDYVVRLQVVDDQGAVAETSRTISVGG